MRTGLLTTFATCCVLGLSAGSASAQSAQLTPFGGQTYASPRHLAGEPADPNRIYVVEAGGTIRLVEGGVTQPGAFLDISADVCAPPDACGGESGLFSVAFAPDYAASGLFYVYFTRDVSRDARARDPRVRFDH